MFDDDDTPPEFVGDGECAPTQHSITLERRHQIMQIAKTVSIDVMDDLDKHEAYIFLQFLRPLITGY